MFRFGNFVFTQDGRICFLHFEIIIYFAEWCTLIDLFLVCFVPLFACRSETRRSACPSPSPYVGIRLDSRKLEKKKIITNAIRGSGTLLLHAVLVRNLRRLRDV